MTISWNNANHIRSNSKDFVGSLIKPWRKNLTSFQQFKIQITKFHFNYLRKDINSKLSSRHLFLTKAILFIVKIRLRVQLIPTSSIATTCFLRDTVRYQQASTQTLLDSAGNLARTLWRTCTRVSAVEDVAIWEKNLFYKVHEWWKNSI
jgi:hypothetical protein